MTENNSFKKQIRARMKIAGETYAQARAHLYDSSYKPDSHYLSLGYLPGNPAPHTGLTLESIFPAEDIPTVSEQLLSQRYGLIVISGAANSGKTMTLNTMLNSSTGLRSISIEYQDRELSVNPDSLHVGLSVSERTEMSAVTKAAMRMWSDMIAFPNLTPIDEDILCCAAHTARTAHLGIIDMHSSSLSNTIQTLNKPLEGDFSSLNAVIEQQRVRSGSRSFFKRSVIVFTDAVRRSAEEYVQHGDEKLLYSQLAEQGVKPAT